MQPVEFVKDLYGEDVTGKYTESDVKAMMTSGRIDDNDINAETEYRDKCEDHIVSRLTGGGKKTKKNRRRRQRKSVIKRRSQNRSKKSIRHHRQRHKTRR